MISESVARKIIHSSAIGLTVINPTMPQANFADTAALTAETIAMVALIVKACGASWTQAAIESTCWCNRRQ